MPQLIMMKEIHIPVIDAETGLPVVDPKTGKETFINGIISSEAQQQCKVQVC